MRASGVRGLLIYCADYKCSHWIRISMDSVVRRCAAVRSADDYPLAIVIRPGESRQVLDSFKYKNPIDSFDCKVVDLVAVSDKELEFFSLGGTLQLLHETDAEAKRLDGTLDDL